MADTIPLSALGGIRPLDAYTDEELAAAPWDHLITLRALNKTPAAQLRLAPFEHRAYAREQVSQSPLMAPVYGAMVPGYQALKAVTGVQNPNEDTPASLGQLVGGLQGVGEGLKSWWNRPRSPASGT